MFSSLSFGLFILTATTSAAQDLSACPLLGPRFPIPRPISSSPIIKSGLQNLTDALDAYLEVGDGEFGPVTPNTTSLSIVLFSTEERDSTSPFLYEYHHTAPTLKTSSKGVREVDADSIYRVGDLTQLFTAYLFLLEAGERYWAESVSTWVPELSANSSTTSKTQWHDITLGDLAAHVGGIGKFQATSQMDSDIAALLGKLVNETHSPCAKGAAACDRAEFLSFFNKHAPVFAPATTPIFSNAGYIILAYALETIKGKPFNELLKDAIIEPLKLSSTSLLEKPVNNRSVIPSESPSTHWDDPVAVEAAFNGLYSSASDISTVLQSILSSSLLTPAATHRWLKPTSHTSNRANSIGRPWEIYSLTVGGPSPVIPVYQVRGNIGHYSSHIGLTPDYNVGFAILAADSEGNPDLNAYADMISIAMIPALEQNAIVQASPAFAGTYRTNTSLLTIAPASDSTPGLALANFTSGDKDVFAVYAKLNGIERQNLSFRLYPTDLTEKTMNGEKITFRAIFQDVTALADAGTPTCDTWRYVDKLQVQGVGLDEFIFEVGADGKAVEVEVRALGLSLEK